MGREAVNFRPAGGKVTHVERGRSSEIPPVQRKGVTVLSQLAVTTVSKPVAECCAPQAIAEQRRDRDDTDRQLLRGEPEPRLDSITLEVSPTNPRLTDSPTSSAVCQRCHTRDEAELVGRQMINCDISA